MRNLIGALLLLPAFTIRAAERPVKLDVEAEWYAVRAGEQVPIRVRLLNAANQPAATTKRLDIQVQARLTSGEVKALRTVTLEPGEFTKQVVIIPPGTGMVYIWAKHSELLPGGAFLAVRALDPANPRGPAPPAQQGRIAVNSQPIPGSRQPGTAATTLARIVPKLALRYSPDRRFLADGKDTATVQAFLLSEPGDTDIRINLFDSSGTMAPIPLTIPGGEDSGRAALTFGQPGNVTVEFLGSEPRAEVDGERKLHIPFMPPITHVTLEASPPSISLVDKAELVISLRDERERPVASDVARHVTFAIRAGRGELTQRELDIGAGQFEARTVFQPAWLGQFAISAATPNLFTVSVPLQVSMPLGLLMCSLGGGLAGGYFSYLKRKRSGRRRIGIGVVTGFIFYWACLFVGLAAIGHAVVVNPFSAFALSAFGGWMQTDVFTLWKSRLKA